MTYSEWFDKHATKHTAIIKKLQAQNFTKEQIIEYFEFSNMVKNEKEFCLLYETQKKCHDIAYLNCYFCACPHFRFKNEGIEKVKKNQIQLLCHRCQRWLTCDLRRCDPSRLLKLHSASYQKIYRAKI